MTIDNRRITLAQEKLQSAAVKLSIELAKPVGFWEKWSRKLFGISIFFSPLENAINTFKQEAENMLQLTGLDSKWLHASRTDVTHLLELAEHDTDTNLISPLINATKTYRSNTLVYEEIMKTIRAFLEDKEQNNMKKNWYTVLQKLHDNPQYTAEAAIVNLLEKVRIFYGATLDDIVPEQLSSKSGYPLANARGSDAALVPSVTLEERAAKKIKELEHAALRCSGTEQKQAQLDLAILQSALAFHRDAGSWLDVCVHIKNNPNWNRNQANFGFFTQPLAEMLVKEIEAIHLGSTQKNMMELQAKIAQTMYTAAQKTTTNADFLHGYIDIIDNIMASHTLPDAEKALATLHNHTKTKAYPITLQIAAEEKPRACSLIKIEPSAWSLAVIPDFADIKKSLHYQDAVILYGDQICYVNYDKAEVSTIEPRNSWNDFKTLKAEFQSPTTDKKAGSRALQCIANLVLRTSPLDAKKLNLSQNKPTLIKQGTRYFVYGAPNGVAWQFTELQANVIDPILSKNKISFTDTNALAPDMTGEICEHIALKNGHTNAITMDSDTMFQLQSMIQKLYDDKCDMLSADKKNIRAI